MACRFLLHVGNPVIPACEAFTRGVNAGTATRNSRQRPTSFHHAAGQSEYANKPVKAQREARLLPNNLGQLVTDLLPTVEMEMQC